MFLPAARSKAKCNNAHLLPLAERQAQKPLYLLYWKGQVHHSRYAQQASLHQKQPCICPTFPSASNEPPVLPIDSNAVVEKHSLRREFPLQNYTQLQLYPFQLFCRGMDLLFSKPSGQSSPLIHLHHK